MDKIADKESIDGIMKLGMGHPMGPLMLADLIGVDVCVSIMKVLEEGLTDPNDNPQPVAGGNAFRSQIIWKRYFLITCS